MSVNVNNISAGTITVNSSASQPKRLTTARMHAARLAGAKSAQRRSQIRTTTRSAKGNHTEAGGNSTTTRAKTSDLVIKFGMGDCPFYNDHAGFVQDPYNRKMYMIGGIRPGDEDDAPTSDFYCCNMPDMSWINLTFRLRRRNPYNPFSKTRPLKTLPRLSFPGCTLLRIGDTSYVALFGGYDCDEDKVMSDILIIDPGKNEWWPLKFEGEGVNLRINPTVVAINGTIYVFGGYRTFKDELPYGLYHSFSIAEHVGEGIYRWSTRDTPYSPSVPVGHVFQEACPVYNGTKIFLTPGRFDSDEPITFTQDNCFFYHTTNKRFQTATADITGSFPPGIRFYSIFSPIAMHPLDSPQNDTGTSSSAHSAPITPYSVIICAHVDVPNTSYVSPEIWHLYLSPEERIECLNIRQKIWDLNSNFQGSAYVDGRVRIMGTDSEYDTDHVEFAKATWNTYLDIPLKR